MTLAEFLLARIAEDERTCEHFRRDAPQTRLEQRLRAEVEAKRRIMEDWKSLAERLDDQGRPLHLFDPATSMLLKMTEPWLRHLVAVYSGHPDYDEAWRA